MLKPTIAPDYPRPIRPPPVSTYHAEPFPGIDDRPAPPPRKVPKPAKGAP